MTKRKMYGVVCLLWMTIIFYFSSQVGDTSNGMSDGVLKIIEDIFHIEIIGGSRAFFDMMVTIVRKGAHMSEYALLAILFYGFLNTYPIPKQKLVFLVLACVFMYACSDEFHQLFVEGRSGQFKDVCIDTFGGGIGLFVLGIFYKVRSLLGKSKAR